MLGYDNKRSINDSQKIQFNLQSVFITWAASAPQVIKHALVTAPPYFYIDASPPPIIISSAMMKMLVGIKNKKTLQLLVVVI